MVFGSIANDGPLTVTLMDASLVITLTPIKLLTWHGVNAYSIQLAWQASGLVSSTTLTLGSPKSSTLASISIVDGPTRMASPKDKDAAAAAGDRGLSTSVKVAIGVVIPIIVLSVVAIAIFFLRRQKSRRQKTSNNNALRTSMQEYKTDTNQQEFVRPLSELEYS